MEQTDNGSWITLLQLTGGSTSHNKRESRFAVITRSSTRRPHYAI